MMLAATTAATSWRAGLDGGTSAAKDSFLCSEDRLAKAEEVLWLAKLSFFLSMAASAASAKAKALPPLATATARDGFTFTSSSSPSSSSSSW